MKTILLIIIQLFIFSSSAMAIIVDEIAISHDKRKAAFIYEEGSKKSLYIYALKDGSVLSSYLLPEGSIVDKLAFSLNDKKINLFSDEGNFAWNLDTKERVQNSPISEIIQESSLPKSILNLKRTTSFDSAAINNKEKTIWIVKRKTIWIWDIDGKKEIAEITFKDLNLKEIHVIKISKDGKYIALDVELKNRETMVIILDGSSYKIVQKIKAQSGFVYGLNFIDNKRLLLHSQYPIEVWNLGLQKRVLNLTKTGDSNSSLIDIYKKSVKPFKAIKSVFGLDVNKDGNIAITGTGDMMHSVLLDKSGKLIQNYKDTYIRGFDARFSPDGSKVAFVYHGEHLCIYDTNSSKAILKLDLGGVPSASRIVKFSKDGRYVAVGSDGSSVSIVDILEKKVSKSIKLNAGVFSLAWINQSKLLIGTKTGLVFVNLKTDKQKQILTNSVISLDINEDDKNRVIAAGTEDGKLYILDKKYKVTHKLPHNGVGRVVFRKDAKYLISSSENRVAIWDKKSYKERCHFSSEVSIWAMAYDNLNHLVYIGDDNGYVYALDENCKKKK